MWIKHNLINLSCIIEQLLFLTFHFYRSHCTEHLCMQLFLIISSGQNPHSGITRSGCMNILTPCHICCSFVDQNQKIRIFTVEPPNWLSLSYLFLNSFSVLACCFCQPGIPHICVLGGQYMQFRTYLILIKFHRLYLAHLSQPANVSLPPIQQLEPLMWEPCLLQLHSSRDGNGNRTPRGCGILFQQH